MHKRGQKNVLNVLLVNAIHAEKVRFEAIT